MLKFQYQILLTIVIIFFFRLPLFSLNKTIDIDERLSKKSIGAYLEYFEDKTTKLKIESIVELSSEKWIKSKKENLGFAYSNSAYWFRFTIKNNLNKIKKIFLQQRYPLISYLNLFIPLEKNKFRIIKTGAKLPFKERPIHYRNFVFPLELQAGEEKTYFLRYLSEGSVNIVLNIQSEKKFQNLRETEPIFLWAFYGILMIMILYNFILFLFVREISYLYYVSYIFFFLLMTMSLNGIAFEYLWPNSLWWANFCRPIFLGLIPIFVLQFIRHFVKTYNYSILLDRIYISLILISLLFVILTPIVNNYQFSMAGTVVLSVVVVLFILPGIIYLVVKKKSRQARFFLASFLLFLSGTTLYLFKSLGILTENFFTNFGMQMGSIAEVTLLSIGLADRINRMKKNMEDLNIDLEKKKDELIDLNENLEDKVIERTEQLNTTLNEVKQERAKSDQLLLNILPKKIADELKTRGNVQPVLFHSASILFTDFKGFTNVAKEMSPQELIKELDACFTQFDDISHHFRLEKLKTIGDSYMCAGGLPDKNYTHAIDCCLAALEIQNFMNQMKEIKKSMGFPFWELRLGINTGPVVGGVIGKTKFTYDVWGDTVNIASRMESGGSSGKVNISASTHKLVKQFFKCESRGKIEVKHGLKIEMFYLLGIKEEFSKNGNGFVPNRKLQANYNKIKRGFGSNTNSTEP